MVTDSGGLQEEAPLFGVPVVVTRSVTTRPESIEAGVSILTGFNMSRVQQVLTDMITNKDNLLTRMAVPAFPYGNGTAARQMADILTRPGVFDMCLDKSSSTRRSHDGV